jgi:hypothetical protein
MILQKHVCLNCPPPQPEDGDIPEQATAMEDPQESEAPESSAKEAGSSAGRTDSSRTESSPVSATSSKSKKRARVDDDEVSSASKQPELSAKSPSECQSGGFDYFTNVIGISS